MTHKILLLLGMLSLALHAIPLTINIQVAVKDSVGRPKPLNNATINFKFLGNSNTQIWSESKQITSPVGLINAKLGDISRIDPSIFQFQDSVKLLILNGTDTILAEPFNTIPFAFKSSFSDSSKNAFTLQGKSLTDIRTETGDTASAVRTAYRTEIRDSIAAHPQTRPTQEIGDTAASVRAGLRLEMRDTAAATQNTFKSNISDSLTALRPVLRANMGDTATTVRNALRDTATALKTLLRANIGDTAGVLRLSYRSEIQDSISAHPGINPSNQIRDTANSVRTTLRSNISDSATALKALLRSNIGDTSVSLRASYRSEIRDSIMAHPPVNPTNQISDSANNVRLQARGWIGDSISILRNTVNVLSNDRYATVISFASYQAIDSFTVPETCLVNIIFVADGASTGTFRFAKSLDNLTLVSPSSTSTVVAVWNIFPFDGSEPAGKVYVCARNSNTLYLKNMLGISYCRFYIDYLPMRKR